MAQTTFSGSFDHSLDGKGRVIIPSSFREALGEDFTITINPDMTVHLKLYNAVIAEGVPQKLEHNDIRWITVDEIDQYSFCPADVEILERLKKTGGRA